MKFSALVILLFACLILLAPLPAPSSDASPQNILFILDASGSMWGRIDGTEKITIAKEVMAELIGELPPGVNAGLQVYGHRSEGDCDDIEVLVPIGQADMATLIMQVRAIQPKGKTPITGSLAVARDQVSSLEGRTAIVLVSDGKETCEGDPCSFTRELRAAGVDIEVHVVGFDVTDEEKQQLSCIADAGGGQYFSAENAGQLREAFSRVKQVLTREATGRLLFKRYRKDGNTSFVDLYIINADGTGERLLVTGQYDMYSTFSPDGARIALSTTYDGKHMLLTVKADGTELTPITDGESPANPDWSPDGAQIAFHEHVDGDYQAFVIKSTGGDKRRLTESGAVGPSWSPDGSLIAYAEDGLHLMRADGTGETVSRDGYVMTGSFQWTPDGQRVVFSERGTIFVMDNDGANVTKLGSGRAPALSPDGSRIAYKNGSRISLMNFDGTGKGSLAQIAGHDLYSPKWSHDGNHVSFISVQTGSYTNNPDLPPDIYIVSVDGTHLTKLTNGALSQGKNPWVSP